MLVFMIKRVRGINRIISIMKGRERNKLTIRESTLYSMRRGARPAGEVTYRYTPKGKPKRQAKKVETKVMYAVSAVAVGSIDNTSRIFSLGMD
jgi:hypothetical protein